MSKKFWRSAAVAMVALTVTLGSAAQAAVPAGKEFNLAASLTKDPLLKATALKHPTVMQSFAYDPYNNDLHTLQVRSGEADSGNLVVTKRPGKSDNTYMVLHGFGPGATMGLQKDSATGKVYLWVESRSVKGSDGVGKGTHISRVEWKTNKHVDNSDPLVKDLTPPGAAGKSPRPVVDQKNNLLVVRTSLFGHKYSFTAYPIAQAGSGNWSNPVYTVTVPQKKVVGSSTKYMTSQGTTAFGNFVYLYWGDAYSSSNPAPKGNTWIQKYRISDGKLVQEKRTEAYKSLSFREPEGIAVYKPRSTAPILGFGFASGDASSRKATIAGKP